MPDLMPQAINSRQALARLPLTRKTDLHELQRAALPFGGLTATPLSALSRVFASPGPIYDPEGRGQDWWRFARVLFAAGFRAGELIHNTFSYHFTPAGFMLEGAAQQAGLPGFSCWRGADRNAGAGDCRSEAGGLRWHTFLPAHHF
jgi:phenylacetate-CoA ligase